MNGKSILIVDDEAPIREMIVVALEMAGYDCLEAENTQQAHALIIDRKPDLILLDWMLPGTSGIELARRLKRDELTADTPIIMLTAKGEEDNKIQGLEVGADDYITKPFSPRELVARLKAVLRRATPVDSEAPIEIGGLLLDPVSHRVTIDSWAGYTMGLEHTRTKLTTVKGCATYMCVATATWLILDAPR